MREIGPKGLPTRRLPKGARIAQVTSLDLVRRVFHRDGPDQPWTTDITGHPTREGKVYCRVVLDAFSRLVVGWQPALGMLTPTEYKDLHKATQPA